MVYNGFAVTEGLPNVEPVDGTSFYSIGSQIYKFDKKRVQSMVGSSKADEFIEKKGDLYQFKIGWIPAGYAHRPDLISQVYYKTPNFWWMILLFNNIKDPFEGLNLGDRIFIPILASRWQ